MNLEKNSNYISPNKNDEAIKKSIQDEKMADTQVQSKKIQKKNAKYHTEA